MNEKLTMLEKVVVKGFLNTDYRLKELERALSQHQRQYLSEIRMLKKYLKKS